MKTQKLMAVLLAVVSLPLWAESKPKATSLTLSEAKSLVYLIPAAQRTRASGSDVEVALQERAFSASRNRYVFYVYSRKSNPNGSPTIGYYSVGKYTADVRDDEMNQPVTNTEIAKLQQELRESHHLASGKKK